MTHFQMVLINRTTNSDELHDVIRLAQKAQYFSADTEGDIITNRSSLIQFELINKETSTIILIETHHLPMEKQSLTFWLIRAILKFILLPSKTIYSWGDAYDELFKFLDCGLFTQEQLRQPCLIDLQEEFKHWHFHQHGYYERKPHEKWGLQPAIHNTFGEFLDKSQRLNRWSRGLYCNPHNPKVRSMIIYAMNDCLAVTKLAFKMGKPI